MYKQLAVLHNLIKVPELIKTWINNLGKILNWVPIILQTHARNKVNVNKL